MSPPKARLQLQTFLEDEHRSLVEIFHWASNLAGSVYTDTTAVVPPEAAYASVVLSGKAPLSQEFLLNYKRSSLDLELPLGIAGYFRFPARSSLALRCLAEEEERDDSGRIVELPPYRNIKDSLGVTIRTRRSRREFTGRPLTMQALSSVLFYGNGVTGDVAMVSEDDDPWPGASLGAPEHDRTRAASSGGGLNPISLYLVAQNVERLEDGVYVYLPLGHALRKVAALDARKRDEHLALGLSWGPNLDPAKANVTLYYVYSVYQNARKYGDMGLMFAVVEAGEIAAHIHLVSTAMNLGSSDLGGWEKVPTERFLGLDGLSKQVVHATVVGTL